MIPTNEMGVVVYFAKHGTGAGFEIVSIQADYPDAIVRRGDEVYRVEFEFTSSNFKSHKHNPLDCDLVICWTHDDKRCLLPVLALSDEDWRQQSVELLSTWEKRAKYWKSRAVKAERRLNKMLESIEMLPGEHDTEEVVKLWEDGNSYKRISETVFGSVGGNQYSKIKMILAQHGQIDNSD